MTLQFKREIELRVTTGKGRLDIKDFHISFTVSANRNEEPNTATMTVFGLNFGTRNLLVTDSLVELYGGFKGLPSPSTTSTETRDNSESNLPPLLFRGNLVKVQHSLVPGQGWVSVFTCGDGEKNYKDTFFSKTYITGTDIGTILKDMANSFGLDTDLSRAKSLVGQKLLKAATYHGSGQQVLHQLTTDYGMVFWVTSGVLEVAEKGADRQFDSVRSVLINKNTGLLTAPSITENGLKVKTLLNGSIKPNTIVTIESNQTAVKVGQDKKTNNYSSSVNGVYIVDSLVHIGDNFGGIFDTISECFGEEEGG